MQQNERIELIKAAAILLNAYLCNEHVSKADFIANFDYFYDYLQLKLEAANDNKRS